MGFGVTTYSCEKKYGSGSRPKRTLHFEPSNGSEIMAEMDRMTVGPMETNMDTKI